MPFDRQSNANRASGSAFGNSVPLQSEQKVRYFGGDITTDGADLLVNTVNCVNVMGKGVALQFKQCFPSIMAAYGAACRSKTLRPGGCLIFPLPDGRKWAALATKDSWRDPSQLQWVRTALLELAKQARIAGVRSIAISPPGCTNGGLDWRVVEPLLLDALKGFDLRIYGRPAGAN